MLQLNTPVSHFSEIHYGDGIFETKQSECDQLTNACLVDVIDSGESDGKLTRENCASVYD
jgi:hypothetical protein